MSKNYLILGLTLAVAFQQQGVAQTTFNYTGSMQTYTVPAGVTSIQIEAYGAQGGDAASHVGGFGASMQGEFTVTPGQVLDILVGGKPAASNGGGGGTFVVDQGTTTPYIIAGGGGGGAGPCCGADSDGDPGVATGDGTTPTDGGCASGAGGTGGSGGGGGSPGINASAGGGGFSGNGGNGDGAVTGGASYLSGGAAGVGYFGDLGGYGGGGGGGNNGGWSEGSGGGGGGYSGGGGTCGSSDWGYGGGGGSLNIGAAQVNVSGANAGNGSVVITELCNGLITTVSDTEVCDGETVTLEAASSGTGTVTWDGGVTDGVPFAPPVGTTTYTATSDDASDCSFSVDILVNPLPTVDAGTDLDVCEGDMVTLTGTGTADTYTWDGGVTDATPFLALAGTTTYTATGEITATGCTETDVVDVTMTTVDEGVVAAGGTITSDQAGGTYQWIDCADTSDVVGATSQAFTPVADGDYAVIVTVGACSDTSVCTAINGAGFDENTGTALKVFPNPTNGEVNVIMAGNFSYELYTLSGQVLFTGKGANATKISLENYQNGTYFLKVINEYETRTIKLVRK